MNIKKSLIFLIVVFLSFLISTSVCFAIGDDQYSRPSLKGLKKVSVVVQIEKPLSEDFKKVDLTEERIRTGIELKLQEAKIDVVYATDLTPEAPILHVDINGSNRNDKTFSFLIEVELWQRTFLKRDPKLEVIAGTWSTGVFGSGLVSNMANEMMGLINSMMDTFVKAYLSVNP
jgi:hypothetical protein